MSRRLLQPSEAMTGAQSLRLYRGAVILFLAAGLIAAVNAATYMVGDDAGTWTIPATTNDLNYTAWAESRNFRFGDDLSKSSSAFQRGSCTVAPLQEDSCRTMI